MKDLSVAFDEKELLKNYVSVSDGRIQIDGDRRAVLLSESALYGLFNAVGAYCEKDAGDVIYGIGLSYGRNFFINLERVALNMFPDVADIRDLDMRRFQAFFSSMVAIVGLGRFTLKKDQDFLFIELENRLFSEITDEAGKQIFRFYSGFFAGIFEKISGIRLACIEFELDSFDLGKCSFLLDNFETIDSVRFWIDSGMSPKNALNKITENAAELGVAPSP